MPIQPIKTIINVNNFFISLFIFKVNNIDSFTIYYLLFTIYYLLFFLFTNKLYFVNG